MTLFILGKVVDFKVAQKLADEMGMGVSYTFMIISLIICYYKYIKIFMCKFSFIKLNDLLTYFHKYVEVYYEICYTILNKFNIYYHNRC
jgi:hypothetical protein